MIENLRQLAHAVRFMRPGEILDVPKKDIRYFWPNPRELWQTDDHLEPPERAKIWADARNLKIYDLIDPPGMRVVKVEPAPELPGTGNCIHIPNGKLRTLCSLNIVQDTKHGPKQLSLARDPRFADCKNCLSIFYGER